MKDFILKHLVGLGAVLAALVCIPTPLILEYGFSLYTPFWVWGPISGAIAFPFILANCWINDPANHKDNSAKHIK